MKHLYRRKKQSFSRRLEHDLAVKRIEAAWKEFNQNKSSIINWEQRLRQLRNPKKVKTELGAKVSMFSCPTLTP